MTKSELIMLLDRKDAALLDLIASHADLIAHVESGSGVNLSWAKAIQRKAEREANK